MTTTWSETDALAPKGLSLAELMLARGAELAPVATRTVEQVVTKAEQAPAQRHLTVVEDVATDDCASGSCQLARPGGDCDCACGGSQHGARSTLAPAACNGTRMLVELAVGGGYRFPRCPGCSDCSRPRLVSVGAATRDPFARIPHVDDAAWI